jgi:hypothetical protein
MNIIENMIVSRVNTLLGKLEVLSGDIIDEVNLKNSSQKVSEFTTAGEISPKDLTRLGRIQMEITLLKGLV